MYKVLISGYGNIIFVGLRMDMHNDSKADVIHKYTSDETSFLKCCDQLLCDVGYLS